MEVTLVMFKPDGARRDFPLRQALTVIGRKRSCGLRIPVPSVSREHCRIEINNEAVHIKDLGSSNGTLVNDEQVKEADLSPGDHLTIGPVHLVVMIDGEPAKIKPIPTVLSKGAVIPVETSPTRMVDDADEDDIDLQVDEDAEIAELAEEAEGSGDIGLTLDEDDSAVPVAKGKKTPSESDAALDALEDEESRDDSVSIGVVDDSADHGKYKEPVPKPQAGSDADGDDPFADLALEALEDSGDDSPNSSGSDITLEVDEEDEK